MKKKWIKVLFVLLIFAGAASAWLAFRPSSLQSAAANTLSSVAVQRSDIEDIVTAQGKLEPKDYVDVGTQVSGQLKRLHVEIGDVVTKGQLLAEIDPKVYESKVQADQAGLKSLQAQILQQDAQVELARQQHRRNQDLFKVQAISQEALDTTQSQLKVTQAQLAALKAQVEEARSSLDGDMANLSYTKIYAPMDGTVVAQSTKEGQTVNASQSAPVIVQLANLGTMTVRAQVAEADVSRLAPGMSVYFTTLGSKRRWDAAIRQILPTPETLNDVVLYNVLVDVDNKDGQLMTGMSTQMFFVAASAKNVLILPASALGRHLEKQDDDTGDAYEVAVASPHGPATKIVRVGILSRASAEIKSGLEENDRIVPPVQNDKSQGENSQRGPRGGFGPRL